MPGFEDPMLDLSKCFDRYRAALRALTDADRNGYNIARIAAAEQVYKSRFALYRCLEAYGWTAPPDIAARLRSEPDGDAETANVLTWFDSEAAVIARQRATDRGASGPAAPTTEASHP